MSNLSSNYCYSDSYAKFTADGSVYTLETPATKITVYDDGRINLMNKQIVQPNYQIKQQIKHQSVQFATPEFLSLVDVALDSLSGSLSNDEADDDEADDDEADDDEADDDEANDDEANDDEANNSKKVSHVEIVLGKRRRNVKLQSTKVETEMPKKRKYTRRVIKQQDSVDEILKQNELKKNDENAKIDEQMIKFIEHSLVKDENAPDIPLTEIYSKWKESEFGVSKFISIGKWIAFYGSMSRNNIKLIRTRQDLQSGKKIMARGIRLV